MRISDWSSDVCSSDLVHQLPGIQGQFEAGGTYQRANRGGHFLYQDFGIYASFQREIAGWRASAAYNGAKRNDRRDVYDAWRQRLRIGIDQGGGAGWRFTLEARDANAKRNDAHYFSVAVASTEGGRGG